MPGNLWALTRERGVVLKRGREHSPTSSRVRLTFARKTLRRIVDRHGEAHAARVLDAILGDRKGEPRNRAGNAGELYGATIQAVSELLRRHPHLAVGNVADLLCDIDLGALRRRAKAMKAGPISAVMLAVLVLTLVDDGTDEEFLILRGEAA